MESTVFEMARKASTDRKAEEKFIVTMEPKVRKVAGRFVAMVENAEQFRDDIENAARLGIHKALMRFDFSYSGFDSYLERSMEIEVRAFLSDSIRAIRIPKHMLESIRKYKNEGFDPTISEKKRNRILDAIRVQDCLSLDMSVSDDENSKTLSDFVPFESSAEDEWHERYMGESLEKAMDALDKDEKYIVLSYFGFNGKKKTIKTMATELGLTVGTVTGRRTRALDKIKSYMLAV